jgi:hypothetical protein
MRRNHLLSTSLAKIIPHECLAGGGGVGLNPGLPCNTRLSDAQNFFLLMMVSVYP